MITPILYFVKNYVTLDLQEDDIAYINALIPVKEYKKGTVLLKEGDISTLSFFNIKGSVRLYYLIDGKEKTAFFFLENKFITAYESFTKKIPSPYYLECMEDSLLASISYEAEQKLTNKYPQLEILTRLILEEELSMYQNMVSSFITLSPQERYLKLLKNNEALINRVPQYHLASYLGVSAESLSRIRKRIIK